MPPKPRAAAGHDINRISWRDWKRFELDEIKSRETGESWQVIGENLTEIDVLLEVMKNDGQIVWHGVAPLHRGEISLWNHRFYNSPCASFNVPLMSFDAPIPTAHDDSEFGSPSPLFYDMTDYVEIALCNRGLFANCYMESMQIRSYMSM
jgi:hypothetical protein